MKNLKLALVSALIATASLVSSASAQYGYDPIMQQMDLLLQQANQNYYGAVAGYQQHAIAYYRQATGDYATPDAQAAIYGEQLWAQNDPQGYQATLNRGQQLQRQDAQGWANTNAQIAQTNSDILDMSYNGYMDRSTMQSQGQTNLIQGAVYGEANYYNSNGSAWSLPVYPDSNMTYNTPEGYPLAFDYSSNTWYVGDASGWWSPLQQR